MNYPTLDSIPKTLSQFMTWKRTPTGNINKTKHQSKTWTDSPILEKSFGLLYRKQRLPIRLPQQFNEGRMISQLEKEGYEEFSSTPLNSKYIFPDQQPVLKIATLSHGLERALQSPGIHYVQDPLTKKYNFPQYLAKLHHPSQVDYDLMPPFVTSSKDARLHRMAQMSNIKWKGSTSSISMALSHIYHLISNYRPVNLHNLSGYFQNQPTRFSPSSRIPIAFNLVPYEGIYSIDKYQIESKNKMLVSLGKSYERMVTMDKETFENRFIKTSQIREKTSFQHHPEAFNYLKIGNFLLRSQLDCYSGEVGIFDLKSRATNPIRIFGHHDPSSYLDYKLTSLTGPTNSFEREYYDMVRSAFLRNIFQVRIGNMSGIFVAYHNTQEIFGFEFLSLDEMEQSIFQSKTMADYTFDMTLKIFDWMLKQTVEKFEKNASIRVFLQARPLANRSNCMYIFVEKSDTAQYPNDIELNSHQQKGEDGDGGGEELGRESHISIHEKFVRMAQTQPLDKILSLIIKEMNEKSLHFFKLTTEISINGKIVTGPLNVYDHDKIRTWAKLVEPKITPKEKALIYLRFLEEFFPFNEKQSR